MKLRSADVILIDIVCRVQNREPNSLFLKLLCSMEISLVAEIYLVFKVAHKFLLESQAL